MIVRCYGCDNLHLIADRLGWFEEGSVDVHDLMAKYGGVEEGAPAQQGVNSSVQLSKEDIEVLVREMRDKAAAVAEEEARIKAGVVRPPGPAPV